MQNKYEEDPIPLWKMEKVRSYYNCGWLMDAIGKKLGLTTYAVAELVHGEVRQTTELGSKTEPYFEKEKDYIKLGPSEPLPKIRFTPGDLTIKDFAKWQQKEAGLEVDKE